MAYTASDFESLGLSPELGHKSCMVVYIEYLYSFTFEAVENVSVLFGRVESYQIRSIYYLKICMHTIVPIQV